MTPPAETTRQSPGWASRRLRRMAFRGRRWRREMTRDRLMELARTLVWVIPLTLLIWIWAQDQQIEVVQVPNVQIRFEHTDPNKVISLLPPNGVDPPLEREQTMRATVAFQGPRANLASVLAPLREQTRDGVLEVQLSTAAVPRTAVELREALAGVRRLTAGGVSVVETNPQQVDIRVEEVVEETADVVAGGELGPEELTAPPVFEPATVTVRGPSGVLDALRGPDGRLEVQARLREDAPPGENEVRAPLSLPQPATGVSMEPGTVQARFVRRERRQVEHTLQSIVVRVEKPAAMEGRLIADGVPEVLNNVVIEGPADVIDRIRRREEQVRAYLPLERDDDLATAAISRQVQFRMPEGVTLRGAPPSITFTVRRVE